jgi:hypothetical protein
MLFREKIGVYCEHLMKHTVHSVGRMQGVSKGVVHTVTAGLLKVNICVGYQTLQQSFESLEWLATDSYITSGRIMVPKIMEKI